MLKRLPLFLLAVLFLQGCFAGKGVYHNVGRGETLWRICYTYGVDVQDVAELNNIKDPAEIKAGSNVFIPGASKVKKVKPYVVPASLDKGDAGKITIEKDRFLWPVKGEVVSVFGIRNGTRHDGVDIRAEEGAPIYAADGGKVLYSKSGMRGYGNLIIIEHNDDFFTVYAHNKDNLVKEGDNVTRGEVIGKVGDTGNASGPHLHFEVRRGKTVRNPLFFLP